MPKTEIRYNGPDRKANDAKAIKDTRTYLGPKSWEALLFELGKVNQAGTAAAFQQISNVLGFIAGVQGYPVHAIGREYCLEAYRAWMHEGGEDFLTDEQGFLIREKVS